jgi:hypothetical protein
MLTDETPSRTGSGILSSNEFLKHSEQVSPKDSFNSVVMSERKQGMRTPVDKDISFVIIEHLPQTFRCRRAKVTLCLDETSGIEQVLTEVM